MPPRQAFLECQRARTRCEEAQDKAPGATEIYSHLKWDVSYSVWNVNWLGGRGKSHGARTEEQSKNRWDQQLFINITEVRNEHDVSHSSLPGAVRLCVMSATPGAVGLCVMSATIQLNP